MSFITFVNFQLVASNVGIELYLRLSSFIASQVVIASADSTKQA